MSNGTWRFNSIFSSLGERHVNPRTLKSRYLSNLVCVEGIVTKCSLVRPKVHCSFLLIYANQVVRSVHYCPATEKTIERRYGDATSYVPIPKYGISFLIYRNPKLSLLDRRACIQRRTRTRIHSKLNLDSANTRLINRLINPNSRTIKLSPCKSSQNALPPANFLEESTLSLTAIWPIV